ncbi:MAG TPA: hypothetical protein VLM40_19545, partial [Gemmata sp.]|nr:hypothetical protein [Gemmata sp.]
MPAGRFSRYFFATLLVGMIVSLGTSRQPDPIKQREEQKKLQAQVDEAARRLRSTLGAMAYQRLSPTAQSGILEGVAKDLRGLSDKQIRDIIEKLDLAVAAPDEATATAAQKEAYAKHRQVIEQLRGMFFKLDV